MSGQWARGQRCMKVESKGILPVTKIAKAHVEKKQTNKIECVRDRVRRRDLPPPCHAEPLGIHLAHIAHADDANGGRLLAEFDHLVQLRLKVEAFQVQRIHRGKKPVDFKQTPIHSQSKPGKKAETSRENGRVVGERRKRMQKRQRKRIFKLIRS